MLQPRSYSKFVVVGAGPIGMYVARRLAGYGRVLVVDSETNSPDTTEHRARFVYQLSGADKDPTSLGSPSLDRNIDFRSVWRAEHIDLLGRVLIAQDGERIGFDQLVLALGASPVIPAFADRNLCNVQTAYYHRDIQALARSSHAGESIAIVGGGPLAIELASVLAITATVTLFVRRRLLRNYCDATIGSRVANHLRSLGVAVESGSEPDTLLGEDRVHFLRLDNGQLFGVDRVVIACGVRANTRLAHIAGLPARDGILVDDNMRTANSSVFAVGDCAQPREGTPDGNLALALQQADRAIAALLGRTMPAATRSASVARRRIGLASLEFSSMTPAQTPSLKARQRIDWRAGNRAYSIQLEERRVVAYEALLPAMEAQRLSDLSESSGAMRTSTRLMLKFGVVASATSASDPIVCQCAGVTRTHFLQVVSQHGGDLSASARRCGAGQYCGSCTQELTALASGNRRTVPRSAVVIAGLTIAICAVIAWLPGAGPGHAVTAYWFKVYALLTAPGVRQASGYFSLMFIGLALSRIGRTQLPDRIRNRWQHACLGTLALAVLPIHTLGGLAVGAGINRFLYWIFLGCILLGVVVLLKRSLRTVAWLHSVATGLLLGALAIHVFVVYQY